MRRLPFVLLGLMIHAGSRADDLGGGAEITPAGGWVQVAVNAPGEPRNPLPTLKYIPSDGRNAAVLLTLLPAEISKVTDRASLKVFFLRGCTPLLPSPEFVPDIRDLALAGGFGVYASFEDPSLVGKPPEKENYKVATPVDVLMKNGFTIQATVFTDDTTGNDFREALGIVQSAVAPKAEAGFAAGDVSVPGLDAVLQLPAGRFKPVGDELISKSGHFFFSDDRHVLLSGWLDRSASFVGMKLFWAREKASIDGKDGIKVQDEKSERIGEWDAILYVVPIGEGISQKNIWACRIVGGTWADIHVSITSAGATWKVLEDTVRSVTLASRRPLQAAP